MNEAMPDWRTFSSRPAPSTGEAGAPDVVPAPPANAGPSWTLVGLVGGGGAALGAGIAMCLVLLLGGGGAAGSWPSEPAQPLAVRSALGVQGEGPEASAVGPATDIVVDVAGGVVEPGLRRLREGDRVGDAIAAAGGFAPRADLVATSSTLNLAESLSDGMKVFVPLLGSTQAAPSGDGGSGLIDINSADQALLETLPGVGPVTATRIMEARADRRFGSVEELRSRGVVGNAVFEDVRDLVRAG
ncbi:ComEA family DNA-binding protein [soil metagenome]